MGWDTSYGGGGGGGEDDSVYNPGFLDSLTKLFATPNDYPPGDAQQAPPPPPGYGQAQQQTWRPPRRQPPYGAGGGYGRFPGGPGPQGPPGGGATSPFEVGGDSGGPYRGDAPQDPRSRQYDERRAWWAQNQDDTGWQDPRRQDSQQPPRAPDRGIVYAPDGTPQQAAGTTPAPQRYGQPWQPWRRRTRYGGMPPGGPMGGGSGPGYGGAALPPTAPATSGYQV